MPTISPNQKKTPPNGRRAFTVTCTEQELSEAKERALERAGSTMNLPGFRPGKAPLDMVRKSISPTALQEDAVHELINTYLPTLVQEHDVHPIVPPNVVLQSTEPLVFEAVFIERPTVTLKNLEKILPEKKEVKPEQKDIDHILHSLQEQHQTSVSVERVSQTGDAVTIDFFGTLKDGSAPKGLEAKGYRVVIGSQSLVPGMEDELIGMTVGETKTCDVTFPESMDHEELKGAVVHFSITLQKIEEIILPALSDAFVKEKLGRTDFATLLEEVQKSVRDQDTYYEMQRRKEELLKNLEAGVTVDVAPELLNEETRNVAEEFKKELEKRSMTMEQYRTERKLTEEQVLQEQQEKALQRLKLRFGIQKLIEEQKSNITDDEVDVEILQMTQHLEAAKDRADVQQQYVQGSSARLQLQWQMTVEKTLNMLCA